MRVSAAVYVSGMVHRVQGRSAHRDRRGTRRFEGRLLSGEPGPHHSSETNDYSRTDDREFAHQMLAATGDLFGARIAIAPTLVARIASHEIGDEHAVQSRARNHAAQQGPGSIAGEWDAGAVSSKTPGRDAHERDLGRRRTVAGNGLRAASDQRGASGASTNEVLNLLERGSLGGSGCGQRAHRTKLSQQSVDREIRDIIES